MKQGAVREMYASRNINNSGSNGVWQHCQRFSEFQRWNAFKEKPNAVEHNLPEYPSNCSTVERQTQIFPQVRTYVMLPEHTTYICYAFLVTVSVNLIISWMIKLAIHYLFTSHDLFICGVLYPQTKNNNIQYVLVYCEVAPHANNLNSSHLILFLLSVEMLSIFQIN